jgi:hypothetical protein
VCVVRVAVSDMELLRVCSQYAGVLEKSPLRVDVKEPPMTGAAEDDDMEAS